MRILYRDDRADGRDGPWPGRDAAEAVFRDWSEGSALRAQWRRRRGVAAIRLAARQIVAKAQRWLGHPVAFGRRASWRGRICQVKEAVFVPGVEKTDEGDGKRLPAFEPTAVGEGGENVAVGWRAGERFAIDVKTGFR